MASRLVLVFLCMLTSAWAGAGVAAVCKPPSPWTDWQTTQQRMISDSRVIDYSDSRQITTSEGQSYAMFFALVNNDRSLFQSLFQWTQVHLAQGDLSSNLPAWLWGRQADGQWGILDTNSASDSDLWIAYNLLEAGRLWKERSYTTVGTLLLAQIARQEVVSLPGFGTMLLPAPVGFVKQGQWKLNPSYLPQQVVQRLALVRDKPWRSLAENTARFLMDSSPGGIAPDWISWTEAQRFIATDPRENTGSYDAIRVYLWNGMLAPEAPHAESLRSHFRPIGQFINDQGQVAERIDLQTMVGSGWAGPGFSAALLPMFKDDPDIASKLLANVEASPTPGYYNQMLTLFGVGWFEGRYRFDAQGHLIPAWAECQ